MGHVAFSKKYATKRSKKELIKPIGLYVGAFIVLVAVVAIGYQAPKDDHISANATSSSSSEVAKAQSSVETPVDEKVAIDVAANIALQANMPVAANVVSLSISLETDKEVSRVDSGAIAKPQIVQTAADNRTIIAYTTKDGDTAQSVGDKFSVSAQTVKWANNLVSDNIEAGRSLVIPPVDGVIYVTKQGDTATSIADIYKASADRITTFNDLEGGIKPDVRIVVPDGILPEDQRPGYQRPTSPAPSVTTSVQSVSNANLKASAGNAYAFGNCTWYVYERRPEIGSYWGNATSWSYSARAAGFTVVQGVPKAGSIFQYGGGYGHVGIVESVNEAAGTMVISDMNGIAGFNRVGYEEVPINKSWNYIY